VFAKHGKEDTAEQSHTTGVSHKEAILSAKSHKSQPSEEEREEERCTRIRLLSEIICPAITPHEIVGNPQKNESVIDQRMTETKDSDECGSYNQKKGHGPNRPHKAPLISKLG
jgi:hypothetical protein